MTTSLLKFIILNIAIANLFNSCINRPQYPDVPHIELVDAQKIRLNANQDSIFIRLKFKDGDGDLGLNISDPPIKEYDIATLNGDTIFIKPQEPYDCQSFITVFRDTIKINRYPNYFNFYLTYYQKGTDGNYSKVNCINNNGRFSRFEPDASYNGPLEGDIAYGFKLYSSTEELYQKTVQMEIYIQDRAGHKSNIIRTQDITF